MGLRLDSKASENHDGGDDVEKEDDGHDGFEGRIIVVMNWLQKCLWLLWFLLPTVMTVMMIVVKDDAADDIVVRWSLWREKEERRDWN